MVFRRIKSGITTHDCASKAMVMDMPELDHDMIQHMASAIKIQTGTLSIVNNQQMRRFRNKKWCVFPLEVQQTLFLQSQCMDNGAISGNQCALAK